MLSKFIKIIGGDPNKREVERISGIVAQINALEPKFESLSDEALRAKTDEFRARLKKELKGISDSKERQEVEQAVLDDLLPSAFAAVREASKRTLGLRPYDVQMIGGVALHQRKIAEMRTGEGKTLVGTLPVYLNALTGRGVHLITVNDYLARRDARWMGPVYRALGLSVGVLQMAAVTENGKKAFLYDPEKSAPQEDKNQMRLVDRNLAYAADITYGTNSEFGFDYLRDNMTMRLDERVQRGHYYAIVDEVDNVLIDEARTPLIISGPAQGDLEYYGQMSQVVRQLDAQDYEISEKDRNVVMTEIGTAHVEQLLGQPLRDPDRPEDVTPEQARLLGYLEQALRAQFLFKRNKDYLVQSGKVVIVDEFTGRQMPGRRWSDGLHQAVEAKEGVKVEPENITYATITIQNYFRMYQKLAGMTGTALTEAEEFHKIYKLDVLPIPTNLEYNAVKTDSPLVEIKTKDENGYQIAYFARRSDLQKTPLSWRRTDYPDMVYRTGEAKLRAIASEIAHDHVQGRPILVGTTSVDSSERLSNRLGAKAIQRLLQIQLLRRAWFEQNDKEEDGRLYAELEPLYRPLDELDATFLRQFAKNLNIASINPEDPSNLQRLLGILRLGQTDESRLKAVIQGGVPHEVLNARKHTEESQIIAGAGAFGAVTIATNMAGRGVDIKLGGELTEEITSAVSRVLKRAGHSDPYNMPLQEQRLALQKLDTPDFGLYEGEVRYFLQHFSDMERVRELGGLHVIGSERHEARRIDNQLRGRAARQGDPGSSRFYLSLQDDLMRMFGGEQVDNIMQRFRLDDDFPLENRIVSNLIEGSQHRVEGANFDVRKHLLEYDDVLNAQRLRIYSQRDRVFTKESLREDLGELLRAEIAARVPTAMQDPEGPWKLLAWLEQTQPSFAYGDGKIYPSFTYRLLLDELSEASGDPRETILNLVRNAVEREEEHLFKAIETGVQRAAERLESQIDERIESLETFLEGLGDSEEQKRPVELQAELQTALQIPVRLSPEQQRALANNPASLAEPLKDAIDNTLTALEIARLTTSTELRLGEPLPLNKEELNRLEWDEAAVRLMQAASKALETRRERLTGPRGQTAQTLQNYFQRVNPAEMDESGLIILLASLARGRRTAFNTKTHRQVVQEYPLFNYFYLSAHLLAGRKADDVQADALEHLEQAYDALENGWGKVEFATLGQNASQLADFGPATETLRLDPALSPASLTEEQRTALSAELGRRRLTDLHRQVLLGSISELWVDYLTRVEALRVSIGLEAYGQRDPLVQYKTKASDMFQALLGEIRTAAVSRMFLYIPRTVSVAENPAEPQQAPAESAPVEAEPQKSGRKRHRRR